MHIIPVIDLMHGQVVQAVQGQRQHYRPIQSQLTDSHALIDVVAAILQVYPFDCLYIADLNAITGDHTQANHQKQIAAAMQTFPTLQWWVDAGIRHVDALQSWQSLGITPILASESQTDLASYQQLKSQAQNSILSLDFFMDGYHGPRAILDDAQHWTQPTLIMSLPKVGAHQGPDRERIRAIKHFAPNQRIYAAGGVRNHADIQALADAGAEGVLVASALHQRQIEWPID